MAFTAILTTVMASKSTQGGFYDYIEEHNHHDAWRMIVLVFVLVAIAILSWFFFGVEKPMPPPVSQVVDDQATRRELLMQSNMSESMTSAEIRDRQKLLDSRYSQAQFTVNEIESRMRLLQGN